MKQLKTEEQVAKGEASMYLIFRKLNPKASNSSLTRISGQQGIVWPHLFDIFKDNHGLANWFSVVNKHRDLLVDWIVLKKHKTFVEKIFFYVFIWNALLFQSPYDSVTEWTRPCPMKLHLMITHV
jgi:hypothetical protein